MSPPQAIDRPLLREAMRAARERDLPRARSLLIDYTQATPDDPLGWLWRAGVAPTPDLGLLWLRRLLEDSPDFGPARRALPQVLLQAAFAAERRQDRAEARRLFAEAAHADPVNIFPWLALARLADSTEEKRSCLGEVLRRQPGHEPARQALAALHQPVPAEEPELPFPVSTEEESATVPAATPLVVDLVEVLPIPRPRPGSTVLVVDGDPGARGLVRESLEPLELRVLEAADAEAAVIALRDHGTPDLILVEGVLPEIDGFQLCKYLRQSEARSATPILLLTAGDGWWLRVRARLAGFTDVLAKPLDPDSLHVAVGRYCSGPATGRTALARGTP